MTIWCSCIRAQYLRNIPINPSCLLTINVAPTSGELVLVEVLAEQGAYTEIEDHLGREIRLHPGDRFVGVLGDRKSGTNLTGIVPTTTLTKGDTIHLLAKGGLIGIARFVPSYYGGSALPLKVIGFPSNNNGRPARLVDAQKVSLPPIEWIPKPILFIAGSSAETGKTTLMTKLLKVAKQINPMLRLGALKICGTGRMADIKRYNAAGADLVLDFVDAGMPSTYEIDRSAYLVLFDSLIASASENADMLLVEIGGDLLDGCAPEAIDRVAAWQAPLILVVNDALGAMGGIYLLNKAGVTSLTVATLTQNRLALAERLNLDQVLDPHDNQQVARILAQYLPDLFSESSAFRA